MDHNDRWLFTAQARLNCIEALRENARRRDSTREGYTQHRDYLSALQSFGKMLEQEEEPDVVIILSVMKACGGIGSLKWARLLHNIVLEKRLESDKQVGNTMVDMYATCGSLLEAESIFDGLLSPSHVSWNALIAGCERQGCFDQAVQQFENMQAEGIKPTCETFVSVLAACTRGGKIKEGHIYYECMVADYGLPLGIEHFNCMIDLLGHTGHLEDALRLLNTSPALPNINGWMSLLTSCFLLGNVDVGKVSFDQVTKLDSETSSGHVLMLNIYAGAQMYDKVSTLQRSLQSQHRARKPGQATLEVDGKLYDFVAGDLNPFHQNLVPTKIKMLFILLRKHGDYVPRAELIFESTLLKEPVNTN